MHSGRDAYQKGAPKPLLSAEEKQLIFQPNEEAEFPTIPFGKPKIPHKVHWVYKNYSIPYSFAQKVRSFYVQNPEWEFHFWTFKTGRELIKQNHPALLQRFDGWGDNEEDNEKKSNMIRYVVLYAYGGVSADLDVYNRRPLDVTTMKYSCIIPTEPFEHSALIYKFEVILSSSILLSRPKHPFLQKVLDTLEFIESSKNAFDENGGGLLTQMFLDYNNLTASDLRKTKTDFSSNSPFFYKGERAEDDDDAVYIPNSQYFMGDINHYLLNDEGTNLKECSKGDTLQANLIKRACAEFASRVELRDKQKYTFTGRLLDSPWTKQYTSRKIHIKKIVPKIIFYE